ncbi:MAG TPA: LamG-like jellyroll fold domain-containing protein [Candidatus Saccharimonadales bacterium]|nr:LamG-like jellyroll fold domain-containing protein [Candidatus Saccharimonadales bacterium]
MNGGFSTAKFAAAVSGLTAILSLASAAFGQTTQAPTPAASSDYVCVQRSPHSRIWRKAVFETNVTGIVRTNFHSYTELATGLCYLDPTTGSYKDSIEQIDLTASGAEAVHGAHKVQWAANAHTPGGAVQLTSPGGQQFSSTVYGLSYWDAAAETNVLIATLQDSFGLVGNNKVLYTNAFSGVNADLEYLYTRAGLEQNVVLREQPPSPANFNLNPNTTFLEVMTTFYKSPAPVKTTVTTDGISDDRILRFDDMLMGQGTAFRTGDKAKGYGLNVTKHWLPQENGNVILIEEVPYTALTNLAGVLPLHSSNTKPDHKIRRTASLPPPLQQPPSRARTVGVMKIAKNEDRSVKKSALVIDYTLAGYDFASSDFIFQSDTTYFVSGVWNFVGLPGTMIFEGGTVVKYTTNATIYDYGSGPGVFAGSEYRPSVFSSWEDDSVGSSIAGSSGSPSLVPSTTFYIEEAGHGLSSNLISNARFSYADYAYTDYSDPVFTFRDCQFINCTSATATKYCTHIYFKNVLCSHCYDIFAGYAELENVDAENVTVDSCPYFAMTNSWWGSCSYSGGITNSILTACDSSTSLFATNCSFVNSSASGIYQTVGAGNYYLASGSANLTGGTTNIDPVLLADLGQKTVYPPIVFSNVVFSTNTSLAPRAERDTYAAALGYHYSPLDYGFGGVTISNAILNVAPGTAVASFGVSYFGLKPLDGAKVSFNGTASSPILFVFENVVQEELTTFAPYSWNGTFTSPSSWTLQSSAAFQFTIWSALSGFMNQVFGDDGGAPSGMSAFSFFGCQFYGGGVTTYSPTLDMTNCLFRRVTTEVSDLDTSIASHVFYNNLFFAGNIFVDHENEGAWLFKDNLFDQTTIGEQDGNLGDPVNYNAYVTNFGTLITPRGSHDVILTNSPAYQTGPLGEFYYPTSLTNLIHTGSETAAAAGLYHYTVTTNNAIEGTNMDSIGFHYVAVDANGQPLDTTGDGLPDYVKDSNGDGIFDTGDLSDWNNPFNIYDQWKTYGGYVPTKLRLSYWRFNSPQLTNEAGAYPISSTSVSTVADWSGTSLAITDISNSVVCYRVFDTNGMTNLNCTNGTVRFWFRPNWTTTNEGGAGGGGNALGVGYGTSDAYGRWELGLGDTSVFGCDDNGITMSPAFDTPTSFISNVWCQVAMTYSPTNVAFYTNGVLVRTLVGAAVAQAPGISNWWYYEVPPGLFYAPPYLTMATGFSVGNTMAYQSSPLDGQIDELETFNFPLSAQAIAAGASSFAGATTSVMQDSDYDGRSDLMETLVDQTDPNVPTNVAHVRLGYWRFNTGDLMGEQGQLPIASGGATLVTNWSGTALNLGSGSTGTVYHDVETNGNINFNCRQGTVRLWFKPNSGSSAPLIYLGDSATNRWSLELTNSGSSIVFVTASNGSPVTILSTNVSLDSGHWTQLTLTYGPGGAALFTNGVLAVTNNVGVTLWPDLATRSNYGIVLGNNSAGTAPLNGQIDELETFNYPLSPVDIASNCSIITRVDGDLDGIPDIIEDISNATSTPFLGTPTVITGVIEAEQFDRGGAGVAYQNVGSHSTNNLRTTLMCINPCDDIGNGYCLDQTVPDEWTRYTINVLVPQTYAIESRVAGLGTNGVFQISFATNDLSGFTHTYATSPSLVVPCTNWTNVTWQTNLAYGTNFMTVTFVSCGSNNNIIGTNVARLNYVSIYPWWQAGFTSTNAPSPLELIAGTNWGAAISNATTIQDAIDNLPSTGGTVLLPSGTFYLAQANPDETGYSWDNAAVGIVSTNVEIQGSGITNTTLIAFNRATTIFYGGNSPTLSGPCATITLRDMTLQSQPHLAVIDTTNVTWETGQLQPVFDAGEIVAFGGPDTNQCCRNILITNCLFLNGSISVEFIWNVSNCIVQNCQFITWSGGNDYVPGQTNSGSNSTPNSGPFGFGVGIFARAAANIVVSDNTFNGNPNLTSTMSNLLGAENGFVYFQELGNWFVADNSISNYALEGIQFSAGPTAAVRNTFTTWARTESTTALCSWNQGGSVLGIDVPTAYITDFVGNNVNGGQVGVNGPFRPDYPVFSVMVSGNNFALGGPPANPAYDDWGGGGLVAGCQTAAIIGNTFSSGDNLMALALSCSNILFLANDASGESFSGLSYIGQPGGLQNAVIIRNIINRGAAYHLKLPPQDASRWILYQNQFIDAHTNTVPPILDPVSAAVHIGN